MAWVVTMWLLVYVCFAEYVDDGEVIVVLSFADRNAPSAGFRAARLQVLDVSWQHTGQQQRETDEWRRLHQQHRLLQCVRSASPARKWHASLWMLWLGTHWTCKHMLSIFRHTTNTWDDLCSLYHDSPFFCIDSELFDTEPSYIQSTGAQEALDVEFRPESYYFTNYVVWLLIYY